MQFLKKLLMAASSAPALATAQLVRKSDRKQQAAMTIDSDGDVKPAPTKAHEAVPDLREQVSSLMDAGSHKEAMMALVSKVEKLTSEVAATNTKVEAVAAAAATAAQATEDGDITELGDLNAAIVHDYAEVKQKQLAQKQLTHYKSNASGATKDLRSLSASDSAKDKKGKLQKPPTNDS